MQTPADGALPPARASNDIGSNAAAAASAPLGALPSLSAGDSTDANLNGTASNGAPTPLSVSAAAAAAAGAATAVPQLQQEDNDLKATLLLFRHLDFCSLGDIGDLIKEFSDNLSARFNAITLRSDLKQFVFGLS